MTSWFKRAVVLVAVTVTPAAAAPPAGELAQVSQIWAREWQAKKLDNVLALYTNDAVFLDADGSHVAGRKALRSFFAHILSLYSAVPHLRSIDNALSGDLAYDWGEYDEAITPAAHPASTIRTHGTYLVILRRVSGRWLIARQVWTGSAPAPAPAK